MSGSATAAGPACAARRVDLAHHSLPHQTRCSLLHHPDELVTRHTGKRIIPFHQFYIRIADTGAQHAHQGLAGWQPGDIQVVPQPQFSPF